MFELPAIVEFCTRLPIVFAFAQSSDSKSAFLIAAFTALITLAGIVLKDHLFKIFEERRANRRADLVIYERYSRPLTASAVSLLHRLHEILKTEHRPVFLKSAVGGNGQGPEFLTYKKLSTLYRLASLLGWVRACRREFSYLRVAEKRDNEPIDQAIELFEKALADGSWVEEERVKRLCDIWHICSAQDLDVAGQLLANLGTKVDNAIYAVESLDALDDTSRELFCANVAHILTVGFTTNEISKASMQRTWPEAFNVIAMREAWVYRDWQSAIGDMMLRTPEDESRKFEVVGYGEFEQIYQDGKHAQRLWINRLSEVFDDLDLSIQDRFDARPRQLRAMAAATAKLILALHSAQGSKSMVTSRTLDIARALLD